MRINGEYHRTIERRGETVWILDQRVLPHRVVWQKLCSLQDAVAAIRDMAVRGAGLIGATAAWGMWLAAKEAAHCAPAEFDAAMDDAAGHLTAARPTAGNLARAVHRQMTAMEGELSVEDKVRAALLTATAIADEDAAFCRHIGRHGLALIRAAHEAKLARGEEAVVNVLTHCNAGWLAFVDHGSALSPIYAAVDAGIPVHVWVDETRPRNQGAGLTAFELAAHNVSHHLVTDNAGGHLMQHGMVDMVFVGADRVTRRGDAANKIGTYLKALAAHDNHVPFYVVFPSSTFDFSMRDGVAEIPVEERSQDEVRLMTGALPDNTLAAVRVCPEATPARNFGFDVTPARLITGLLTERGLCPATEAGICELFPEAEAGADRLSSRADDVTDAQDGVVKFQAAHSVCDLPAALSHHVARLAKARAGLHDAGLVGLSGGIGFGNLSCRIPLAFGSFLVTGTGTGAPRELGAADFAVVEASFPTENYLLSSGPVRPSSESMTHAAIYAAREDIGCVIHVHSRDLFARLMARETPRTPENVAYGTPAMALAVAKLAEELPGEGVVVTPGHQDGVFAFGGDPARVTARLLALLAGEEIR